LHNAIKQSKFAFTLNMEFLLTNLFHEFRSRYTLFHRWIFATDVSYNGRY